MPQCVIHTDGVRWWPVPQTFHRKLRPFERALYLAHLRTLTTEDRRRRFQLSVGEESLADYVERIDFRATILLGCFVDGVLRGVAEVAFERPDSRVAAEVAVSIDPAWQGRGLGGSLTRRALRIARNRGAARVCMFCLPDNEPMLRIAAKLEGQLALHDGTVDAELQLRPPTPITRLGEQLEDGHGIYGSLSSLVFARVG